MGSRRLLSSCIGQCVRGLEGSLTTLRLTREALHQKRQGRRSPDDRRALLIAYQAAAAESMSRAGFLWERFIDDWLLTAIAADTSALRARWEYSAAQHRRETQRNLPRDLIELGAALSITVPVPPSLSLSRLRVLLDPTGRNISVPGRVNLTQGHRDLAPRYQTALAAQIGPVAGLHLHTAVVRIRDVLAHDSPQSREAVTTALQVLEYKRQHLGRTTEQVLTAAGVARYLSAKPAGAAGCRAELFHGELLDLAKRFPAADPGS